MHLEKEKIWARVRDPVVVVEVKDKAKVKAKVKVKVKAKAVAVVVIKAVLSAPADIVFVQNVAKKSHISGELNALQ